MSSSLAEELRLALADLNLVRVQFEHFESKLGEPEIETLEAYALCAILHSFYTEIEKSLKRIALAVDGSLPSGEQWHLQLLSQMSKATAKRPAVIDPESVELLGEYRAFRHLFRGASIVLMRWDKLEPLVRNVDRTHLRFVELIHRFLEHQEQNQAATEP